VDSAGDRAARIFPVDANYHSVALRCFEYWYVGASARGPRRRCSDPAALTRARGPATCTARGPTHSAQATNLAEPGIGFTAVGDGLVECGCFAAPPLNATTGPLALDGGAHCDVSCGDAAAAALACGDLVTEPVDPSGAHPTAVYTFETLKYSTACERVCRSRHVRAHASAARWTCG